MASLGGNDHADELRDELLRLSGTVEENGQNLENIACSTMLINFSRWLDDSSPELRRQFGLEINDGNMEAILKFIRIGINYE